MNNWHPKVGNWHIGIRGEVYHLNSDGNPDQFGLDRDTQDETYKAWASMMTHNRLLAYVAEFDKDYTPNWDVELPKWFIYQIGDKWYTDYTLRLKAVGCVYMSENCAKGLILKLQSGEVIL